MCVGAISNRPYNVKESPTGCFFIFYSHFFTANILLFIIASVTFLYAVFAILLKVGADTHIFSHHSFIFIQSILISFIASSSSQKISTTSFASSFHAG